MITFCSSSVRPCVRPLTFSNDFSSKAAKPILLKYHMDPPLVGGTKDCLNGHGPPCPYMVKSYVNLLLQNQGCLWAESLHKSSGTKDLPDLAKMMVLHWGLTFYGEVKFASLCICMGSIHVYGKNVEKYKRLLLWSGRSSVAQISCGAFLGKGNERLLKWSRSIDQDGCHAHIW